MSKTMQRGARRELLTLALGQRPQHQDATAGEAGNVSVPPPPSGPPPLPGPPPPKASKGQGRSHGRKGSSPPPRSRSAGSSRDASWITQAPQTQTGEAGPDVQEALMRQLSRLPPGRVIPDPFGVAVFRIGPERHGYVYFTLPGRYWRGKPIYKCVRGDYPAGPLSPNTYYLFYDLFCGWTAGCGPNFLDIDADLPRLLELRYRMPYQGDQWDDPAESGWYIWQRWVPAYWPANMQDGEWADMGGGFRHVTIPRERWPELIRPGQLQIVLMGQ